MSKIFNFFSFFIPLLLIVVGLRLASVAVLALLQTTKNLECFCPSCAETAFANKGALSLGLIKVDIQGAVKKPGIYQLEIGQRVADLISTAGGFVKDADQFYVAKTLNLATELKNQDKIYIPFSGENLIEEDQAAAHLDEPAVTLGISINQATLEQLQALTGIGEVKAQTIIANRPYLQLEELLSKGVLSENLFNSLKTQLKL